MHSHLSRHIRIVFPFYFWSTFYGQRYSMHFPLLFRWYSFEFLQNILLIFSSSSGLEKDEVQHEGSDFPLTKQTGKKSNCYSVFHLALFRVCQSNNFCFIRDSILVITKLIESGNGNISFLENQGQFAVCFASAIDIGALRWLDERDIKLRVFFISLPVIESTFEAKK